MAQPAREAESHAPPRFLKSQRCEKSPISVFRRHQASVTEPLYRHISPKHLSALLLRMSRPLPSACQVCALLHFQHSTSSSTERPLPAETVSELKYVCVLIQA